MVTMLLENPGLSWNIQNLWIILMSYLSCILKVLNKILIIGYYLIDLTFFLSWKILDFFCFMLFCPGISWNFVAESPGKSQNMSWNLQKKFAWTP